MTSVRQWEHTISVRDKVIYREQDLVKFDDTWLKLYRMMFESLRKQNQAHRLTNFKDKDVKEY